MRQARAAKLPRTCPLESNAARGARADARQNRSSQGGSRVAPGLPPAWHLAAPARAQAPDAAAPPVVNSRLTAPVLLPVADRRDRAARRLGRLGLRTDPRRGAQDARRAVVPSRHRDRAAGARGRPGARRRQLPGARRCRPRSTRCATRCSCWSRSIACPRRSEPLRALLAQTPAGERPLLIAVTPRLYARAADKTAAATALEAALADSLASPATATAARVAIGRAWLAARDAPRALALAARAHRDDPAADGPALLALELMPSQPAAEAIVDRLPRRQARQQRGARDVCAHAERGAATRRRDCADADRGRQRAQRAGALAHARRVAPRTAPGPAGDGRARALRRRWRPRRGRAVDPCGERGRRRRRRRRTTTRRARRARSA